MQRRLGVVINLRLSSSASALALLHAVAILTDMRGVVARVTDRGFGFVTSPDADKDIFFHAKELSGVEYNDLRESDEVEFDVIEGPKGPAAANVRRSDDVVEETAEDEAGADVAAGVRAQVQIALHDLCVRLAHLVAKHPAALDEIEHRDMERLVAEVFAGLGFDVELTPGAGDGGKDVVVSYLELGKRRTFFIEVKHWRSGKRVGGGKLDAFIHAIAKEGVDGGVLLSSSGFSKKSIEHIMEIDRVRVGLGTGHKIACLCRNYARARSGIWTAPRSLETVVFEDTQEG